MILNTFPPSVKNVWCSFDTEARLRWVQSDVILTNDEVDELPDNYTQADIRKLVYVDTYCYSISDGTHIAILETVEEFYDFIAFHSIPFLYCFNAKYDFTTLYIYMISNGWECLPRSVKRFKPNTYISLHNDMGSKYMLQADIPTKHKKRGCHRVNFYDAANIFTNTKLEKLLENFKVKNNDGKDIRKTTMNYQLTELTDDDINYIISDTHGLYHLIRTVDKEFRNSTGYGLANPSKPDIITVGGFAKKVLLNNYLYPEARNYSESKRIYQSQHRMSVDFDQRLRIANLYRGGLVIINSNYQGEPITQPVYKYDYHSHYPAQMREMPAIRSTVTYMYTLDQYMQYKDRDKYVYVFEIESAHGSIKPDKRGVNMWFDPRTREYTDTIHYIANDDDQLLMFDFEFFEMMEWYDLNFEIKAVYAFATFKNDGYREFVDVYYKMKEESKVYKDASRSMLAKIMLNSSYGKFGENPVRVRCYHTINDKDALSLVITDETETDESSMLNVIQAAYITAMGRVKLMSDCRKYCDNISEQLIYGDTDSAHLTVKIPDDDLSPIIGGFGDECEVGGVTIPYEWCKYLAPKTYIQGRRLDNVWCYDIYCKGVSKKVVAESVDGRPPEEVDKIFAPNVKFKCLSKLNVRGGAALVPLYKHIMTDDDYINNEGVI